MVRESLLMRKKCLIKILSATLTVLSLSSVFASKVNAEWIEKDVEWYYKDGDSYYTGWKLIDRNWYYFYPDGHMATNDKIDDYFVNSAGAWTDSITGDEAIQLVLNEDSNFINSLTKKGGLISYFYNEFKYFDSISDAWNIPREDYYEVLIDCPNKNGQEYRYAYLVGKDSKNIYAMPHQAGQHVYQIQDNKEVKVIPYTRNGEHSYDWRNF